MVMSYGGAQPNRWLAGTASGLLLKASVDQQVAPLASLRKFTDRRGVAGMVPTA
jgi:hypothetical protein